VVLDPPYMYHSSTPHKESIDRGYANNERVAAGIHGVGPVHAMYFRGMSEARRVLVPDGVLIVKCQDQIMSGGSNYERATVQTAHQFVGVGCERVGVR